MHRELAVMLGAIQDEKFAMYACQKAVAVAFVQEAEMVILFGISETDSTQIEKVSLFYRRHSFSWPHCNLRVAESWHR